ncbi:MAG: hypothetical protein L0214_13265 [candidate division NC10 bacterium]|nr:hypothetical protein [candidate division NC10 bacterium]
MSKLKVLLLSAVLVALGVTLPYVAESQFGANTLTINSAPSGSTPSLRAEGLSANIGINITPKGGGVLSTTAFSSGSIDASGLTQLATLNVTDGVAQQYFIRAVDHCRADTPAATLVAVRLATGDWALARTAAGAETYNITCNFPLPYRIAANKGWRLDSFSIAHQITVVNLTSSTFQQLSQVTYSNNVANSVTAFGGAIGITMPTVVQANPYNTAATVGTPTFVTVNNSSIVVDWQVVMANTGVYRVYGVVANFTGALY